MNNELIERIDFLQKYYPRDAIGDLLRDCKAALTQQQEAEPVAVVRFHGHPKPGIEWLVDEVRNGTKLYLHPPAAPLAMETYQAVENELSTIMSTVSSFESPAKAVAALIDWHVQVERDPKVNGQAQPQVPEGWDEGAYKSACDGLEYWKQRASDSEQALERIRNDLSPAHMGEPAIEKDREEFLSWISYLEAGKQINYEISAKIALCMRGCLKHFRTCFSGQRFTGLREKAKQEIEFLRLAADQYEGMEDYALAADQIRLVSLIRDLLSAAKEEGK